MEGVQTQISIGQESSWGTAVTPTVSVGVMPSTGIQVKQENIGQETISGTAPKNKAVYAGVRTYEGGYIVPAFPNFLGYILKSVFGAPTTTSPEASAYKHVFAESLTKFSLTVEQAMGSYVKRFAGYKLGNFKVSGKTGEQILVEFGGIAKSQADATKITGAFETRRAFNFADVTAISIGGTDIKAKVQDFEVEYKNGLTAFHGFGANEPAATYGGQSTFEGKLTLILDSDTKAYVADHIAATERALVIDMTGVLVGATQKDELKIMADKCVFQASETPIDYGMYAVSLEFTGREDATNGLVKVELYNGVSTL